MRFKNTNWFSEALARWQHIKIAREMLVRNQWSEEEILTSLGKLDLCYEEERVMFVACRPGDEEQKLLIFRGTAIAESMDGEHTVLVLLSNGRGTAEMPSWTPCLLLPRQDEDDE